MVTDLSAVPPVHNNRPVFNTRHLSDPASMAREILVHHERSYEEWCQHASTARPISTRATSRREPSQTPPGTR